MADNMATQHQQGSNNTSQQGSNALQTGSNGVAMAQQGTSNALQTHRKASAKARKVLATPQQQGSESRKPLSLQGFVVGNQVAISDPKVPQYSLFVLNPTDTELYIKVSKAQCIQLSSKQRYSAAIGGYLVSLVGKDG